MAHFSIALPELTDNDPVAEQPQGSLIPLKRHQLTLLARAKYLESSRLPYPAPDSARDPNREAYMRSRVGVLCDPAGAGKSFVILGLVCDDFAIADEPVIFSYRGGLVVTSHHVVRSCVDTNVLVIPHNLCNQWVAYIQGFCPGLRYVHVFRNKHFEKFQETELQEYRLVVVTCTMYNRLAAYIDQLGLTVRRTIYDEVDSMNIPSCAHIPSAFTWFVTASYGNLLYPRGHSYYDYTRHAYIPTACGLKNMGFIRDLFLELRSNLPDALCRQLFLKNSDAYVQASMQLPPVHVRKVECRSSSTVGILNGLVDTQIMSCLNANDIQGALQYISPGQKQSEDSIISILIDKLQRNLKNVEVRLEYTLLMEFENDQQKEQEVARLRARIGEQQARIQCIRERVLASNTCPICYDDIGADRKCVMACCSNTFCFKCINVWLSGNRVCPLCKQAVDREHNMYVVSPSDAAAASSSHGPPVNYQSQIHESNDKLRNLENILRTLGLPGHARGKKVLIFSAYDNTFVDVAALLARLGIRHSYLKGNSHVIKNLVDGYKHGDIQVLLVNTTYYGSGLNLENTTDMIMFHKFDSEIEKQVVGRAHRYGRTEPLAVWYLLHHNEM